MHDYSSAPNITKILAIHAEMLNANPYCYFELAYTRTTDWMVFICSNHRDVDPKRKVLLTGQGMTPDAACKDALEKFKESINARSK